MSEKSFDNGDTFALPENIVFREEENGAFLFNVNFNLLKAVNETGRDIIKYIEANNTIDEITRRMTADYDNVAEIRLREDVEQFIRQLLEQNYLIKNGSNA